MQNAWRFIDDEILREPATRKPIRQRTWHRGRLPTRRRRRSRCPSSRWATANLPVAKRILAATDKSIAWLADPSHRDEAIELLVKVARSSIEDAEPQRDCGPARNQSAWRHEAQAARRPGSQCRRHLLRTRVGASRAIRAQSGRSWNCSRPTRVHQPPAPLRRGSLFEPLERKVGLQGGPHTTIGGNGPDDGPQWRSRRPTAWLGI